MRVAGLELIKLSHISLDICLCCPSLEYIKMELHKFNSTKFLMNTQQPSKLNTKTKRNTNFSIPALEVPLLPRSYDCLVDVWKVSGLRLRAASGAKGYFGWIKFTCQNNTNSVMLTQYQRKEDLKSILLRYMFWSFAPARPDADTRCAFFAMCCS